MSRLVRRFSWKFFLLVVVLAALSLSAPEAWRRYQARQALSRDAVESLELAQVTPPQPLYESLRTNEPIPVFEVPEFPAESTELAPAAIEPTKTGLEAFATPKQVAKTGPVVAEQIDNDPSLAETPTRTAVKVEPAIEFEKPADPIERAPAEAPAISPPATPAEVIEPSPSPAPVEPRTLPDHQSLKPSVPPDVAPAPQNASAGVWPHATALVAQLRDLASGEPQVATWAQQTIEQLEDLAKVDSLASPRVGGILDQLHALSLKARDLAAPLKTDNQRSRVLRSGYAISRRIAVWQLAHAVAFESHAIEIATPNANEWQACLQQLEYKLSTLPGGAPWVNYLRLPQARKLASPEMPAGDRRALARDILRRLNSTQFDPQQGDFADSPVFTGLTAHLKHWADEPVNLTGVLQAIEDYEREDLTAESTAVAEFYQQIRWSPDKKLAELGDTINSYYRNGNVRVAVSAELVNRFLPKEARMAEYVQDYIQGAYVEGNSEASTRLRLVLLPDRLRWRLGLEAQGEVASDTSSTKGPATFYQNGTSHYRVRKMLLVDRRGVRLFNAEAEANAGDNHLNNFETTYDPIPILGSIVRAVARDQYDQAQDSARAEVEGKIRGRATTRIDQAVAEQLKKGQENFRVKLLEPLRKLNLEPAPVDMETTNDRLIARYRLAGHEQLASHTPRPQAPGDSLLSVQVHETAFNNLINHLNLAGKRYELRELHKEVTSVFTPNPPPPPDDLPEDVYVTFMDSDPIRVDCEDGRVRLTIRIKQLEHGKSKWQNFTVRGYYAPYSDQLEANLARDGVIELIGERLRVGDQIALRGIFSRVLSRNRTLNLVNKQIALAPELRDQQVTQLVIHDGWIGVALGPKHPERKTIGVTRAKQKDGETR